MNNPRGRCIRLAAVILIGACKGAAPAAAPAAPPAEPLAPTAAETSPDEPAGFGSAPSPDAFAKTMSPAEMKWGMSVTPDPTVTYQDDVVVLPHGADAVRGMESNGLGWTIDANAPGADAIETGKILFATGRVMGRVIAMEKNGGDFKVTLGPVELTDVIKDCKISTEVPIDMSSMLVYTAPGYPGAVAQMPKESESGQWQQQGGDAPRMSFADYRTPGSVALHPPAGGPNTMSLTVADFTMVPYCCGGIGMKLLHKGSDAIVVAYAIVRLSPSTRLKFDLDISGGAIRTALVSVTGGAGFTVYFNAATTIGMKGNINAAFYLPSDWTIPISGLGVPFAVTLRQTMVLTTAFTAKEAIISATGDYGFSSALTMGLNNGSWGITGPEALTTKENLLGSIKGASLGVNGLTIAYGGKVMVGIGAYGFITGPFLSYNTAVGVTRGSDMTVASPLCRSVKFEQWMAVGVGYQIPQMVTSAINSVLRLLGLKEIEGSGGVETKKPLTSKFDFFPAGCGPAPQ